MSTLFLQREEQGLAEMPMSGRGPRWSRVQNELGETLMVRLSTSQLDWVTWIICLLLSFFCLTGSNYQQLPAVQWAPWVIGILFLSLPHGGLDDTLPSILRDEGLQRRGRRFGFYFGYIGVMIGTLAIWMVRADLGLLSFLLFSGYHFGQGDLFWSHQRRILAGLSSDPGTYRKAVLLLARGGISVFLPFVIHDQQFQEIGELLSIESGQSIALPDWFSRHRSLLLSALGGLALVDAAFAFTRIFDRRTTAAERRIEFIGLGEIAILLIFFSLVPPILSVGAYILCWHAPRHVWRLMLLDPALREQLAIGRSVRAVAGFHRKAAGMVVAASIILVLISALCIRYEFAAVRLIFPAFLFVNAITVPHIITVIMLDRFQSVWSCGRSS